MASIGKATWFALLTAWIVGVAVTIVLATAPQDEPGLLRVSNTRGPQTRPALVPVPLEGVAWSSR